MISSKFHAILDYIVGFLLIGAPLLFGFSDKTPAMLVATILGTSTILYSIFTKYEYSLLPVIPYRSHLAFDFLSGLILLLSPWLFGFQEHVYLPHLIFGSFEIIAVIFSRKSPESIQKVTRT